MPVYLQAGKLRTRIRVERRGLPVSDNAGNFVSEWQTLCNRSAQIKAVPVTNASAESIIQGRLTGTAFMSITVRFDGATRGITSDDRVVNIETGDIYNVRSALDLDGDRRFITMDCEKGVAT
jgi:head-tail adaptor